MRNLTKTGRAQGGAALVLALEVVILIVALVAIMLQAVHTENIATDSLVLEAQASYIAESGAEYAIKQLTQAIAARTVLPSGFPDVKVLQGYVPGYPFTSNKEKSEVEYKIFRMTAPVVHLTPDGTFHTFQSYAVSARGYVPDPFNSERFNEVYINKTVELDIVPLFQFLAFYSKYDLEILPGNNATLSGRIHTNRDLYLGVQPGKTLVVDTKLVRSSGALRRHRKNDPADNMLGTVRIKRFNAADGAAVNDANFPIVQGAGTLKAVNGTTIPLTSAPHGYDSSFLGYDGTTPVKDGDTKDATDLPSFAEGSGARWEGTVQTAGDSVPEFSAPTDVNAFRKPDVGEAPTHKYNPATKEWETGSGATHVPGVYLNTANIVVVNNKIKLPDGTDITTQMKTSSGTAISGVVSEKTFFEGREYDAGPDAAAAGKIKVTEIDIAKLNTAHYNGQPVFPTTGNGAVIYAYRTDSTATTPHGIRMVNGSTLNNKMTFVSENPVYVKGNFNTAGKKGVAIMADAVTMLSNEWSDTAKSTAGAAAPVPTSSLEVNAAIVTGGYETIAPEGSTPGKYNGGFENLPRFLEDWGKAGTNAAQEVPSRLVNIKIRGSFVSLYESQYGKGAWGKANVYSAPIRDWNFDTDFLNPNFLPPGFPVGVASQRVVWWKERNLTWWPQN